MLAVPRDPRAFGFATRRFFAAGFADFFPRAADFGFAPERPFFAARVCRPRVDFVFAMRVPLARAREKVTLYTTSIASRSTHPRRPSSRSTCAQPSRVPSRRSVLPGFAWK